MSGKIPKTKTCNKCHQTKSRSHFECVIYRRTYDVGSDDDGWEAFLKFTKLCRTCRDSARERIKLSKEGKLTVEFLE